MTYLYSPQTLLLSNFNILTFSMHTRLSQTEWYTSQVSVSSIRKGRNFKFFVTSRTFYADYGGRRWHTCDDRPTATLEWDQVPAGEAGEEILETFRKFRQQDFMCFWSLGSSINGKLLELLVKLLKLVLDNNKRYAKYNPGRCKRNWLPKLIIGSCQ